MTVTPSNIILIITATTTALIAGLFYAWSCSVTLGLATLSDAEYIAAMQAMNRAILNPVFFASFLGTAILLPLSSYLNYSHPLTHRFWFLIAATAIYIVGVFGVTAFGNVPLNESLDAFNLQSASVQEIVEQRTEFENPWNSLNTIRTVASTLSVILVIIVCLSSKDK